MCSHVPRDEAATAPALCSPLCAPSRLSTAGTQHGDVCSAAFLCHCSHRTNREVVAEV